MAENNQYCDGYGCVCVKDFGAEGNSTTGNDGADDTDAIQNALYSGAKSILLNNGCYRITKTIIVPDGVRFYGEDMWNSIIIADPNMDGSKDVMQNAAYDAVIPNIGAPLSIETMTIHGNAFQRKKFIADIESGRCLRLGGADSPYLYSVVFKEGPQHGLDITCWRDQYIGIGHHGIAPGRSRNAKIVNCYAIDWRADDGMTTHALEGGIFEHCTSIITPSAIEKNKIGGGYYQGTQCGFEIDDGSHDVVVSNCKAYGGGTTTKGFATACHPNNPATYNIRFINCDAYETYVGVSFWAGYSDLVVYDSEDWLCRGYIAENIGFIYPFVDANNTLYPTRSISTQYTKDVTVNGLRVQMCGLNNEAARTPVAMIQLHSTHNFTLTNFHVHGVPDGTVFTDYSTFGAWIAVEGDSLNEPKNVNVDGVYIDNIGWSDRIIRDYDTEDGSGTLCSVRNICLERNSTDGRQKTVIVSKANCEYENITAPSEVQRFNIGTYFYEYDEMTGDIKRNVKNIDSIIGGLRIRSETTSGGVQPVPGILFDRQFVSGHNYNGKGSISFRTSADAVGSFSITAYDEDSEQYEPMISMAYQPSSSVKKYFSPVFDGDMNCGTYLSAWQNGYFVNAPQTLSDARMKSPVMSLNDAEYAAAAALCDEIGSFHWLAQHADRIHIGLTVQRAIQIMELHGLDPFAYSFICYDEWDDEYQIVHESDSAGEKTNTSAERVLTNKAGSRYWFRDAELIKFLMAGTNRRLRTTEKASLALQDELKKLTIRLAKIEEGKQL